MMSLGWMVDDYVRVDKITRKIIDVIVGRIKRGNSYQVSVLEVRTNVQQSLGN